MLNFQLNTYDNSQGLGQAPKSPCIDVCSVDDCGICLGCGRTLDEIAAWPGMSEGQQRQLLQDLARRKD